MTAVYMRLLFLVGLLFPAVSFRVKSRAKHIASQGPATGNASAESQPGPEFKTLNKQVRFLFIRHALSCANMVQEYVGGLLGKWSKNSLHDPMLSECGAVRSERAGEELKKLVEPDLVLSSSMLRAMETAAYMFPGRTIIPVPYISEVQKVSFEKDNSPREVDDQWEQLRLAVNAGGRANMGPLQGLASTNSSTLDMTWMTKPDSFFPTKKARTSSDWTAFIKFMEHDFLPSLTLPETQEWPLTIAVVSHSLFLAKVPVIKEFSSGRYNEKPENNQVLEIFYNYEGKLHMAYSFEEGETTHKGTWVETFDPFDLTTLSKVLNDEQFKERAEKITSVTPVHTLTPFSHQECNSPLVVPESPKKFCRADVGDVCRAEIEVAFQGSIFATGKIKLLDEEKMEAVTKADEAGRMLHESPGDKKLKTEYDKLVARMEELKQYQCCV